MGPTYLHNEIALRRVVDGDVPGVCQRRAVNVDMRELHEHFAHRLPTCGRDRASHKKYRPKITLNRRMLYRSHRKY
jgi:hypothetical protein